MSAIGTSLMNRIALISTPWPLFNRPSIQLGSLKAFVRQKLSATQVNTHHIYLTIAQGLGHNLYSNISERTWLAESLYAALLYPGHMETIAKFWKRKSSGVPLVEGCSFDELFHTVNKISAQVLDHETWDRYLLAGFSICFGQITSSLYYIREIKQRAPDIKIVNYSNLTEVSDDYGKVVHIETPKEYIECGAVSGKDKRELGCGKLIPLKDFLDNFHVCPECGYSYILGATGWIDCLADTGSFHELYRNVTVDQLLAEESITDYYRDFLARQKGRSISKSPW